MKKVALVSLLGITLCGCVSTGPTIPTPSELQSRASSAFVGGNVSRIADRFGIPQAQDEFQRKHYALWHASNTINWRQNVTSTQAGRIGSDTWPYQSVPYKAETQSQQLVPEEYRCTMQVEVDNDGIVKAVGFVGKMGACQAFMP